MRAADIYLLRCADEPTVGDALPLIPEAAEQ